jgi:hypothetical protein
MENGVSGKPSKTMLTKRTIIKPNLRNIKAINVYRPCRGFDDTEQSQQGTGLPGPGSSHYSNLCMPRLKTVSSAVWASNLQAFTYNSKVYVS